MLSIPSLRWLRVVLNLTGLGIQSVHFPRAKLFSIQFPLPPYGRGPNENIPISLADG
jgi:hypothetical protein